MTAYTSQQSAATVGSSSSSVHGMSSLVAQLSRLDFFNSYTATFLSFFSVTFLQTRMPFYFTFILFWSCNVQSRIFSVPFESICSERYHSILFQSSVCECPSWMSGRENLMILGYNERHIYSECTGNNTWAKK